MNEAPKLLKIKKVQPYPFKAQLEHGGIKTFVDVLFVDKRGFIARLATLIAHVGSFYKVEFELPALKRFVVGDVRVLKTYDKSLNGKEFSVERVAEFHFTNIHADHKANIDTFVKAIGQK